MLTRLTDAVFDTFREKGYVILERYLDKSQRREMLAAIRRILPPWEQVKHDPPPRRIDHRYFPYSEMCLNRAIVDREAIAFSRRWLGTDHIHYRPGLALVNYPGYRGDSGEPHIDNGNNSLLPPTSQRGGYAQINFWFYLDDVAANQAPFRVIATEDGRDLSKAEVMTAPGGSVAIFDNYTWHSASNYTRQDGQRYIWKFAWGRADHYWEGVEHYTHVGQDPHFRAFIGELSAEDRMLFRFPPPGHPYYTSQTLAALEAQYPGWNARGEY